MHSVTPAIPATQQWIQDIVNNFDHLQSLFAPVKSLATNVTGVSISVAKTLYVLFPCTVVVCLPPVLYQLPGKFQNQAMRFIVMCPPPTRIANIQSDLTYPHL